jgi:DNA-binding MarR family transcriptional regulator
MPRRLDQDLLFVLYDVARLMRVDADKRARTRGMTRAQWVILVHLERQPGLSQAELANLVEVEPITVARLVDRLEARGLVERRHDPHDRRIWRLHLTDAAAAELVGIHDYRGSLRRRMEAGIDAASIDALTDVLLRMKDNLNADGGPIEDSPSAASGTKRHA